MQRDMKKKLVYFTIFIVGTITVLAYNFYTFKNSYPKEHTIFDNYKVLKVLNYFDINYEDGLTNRMFIDTRREYRWAIQKEFSKDITDSQKMMIWENYKSIVKSQHRLKELFEYMEVDMLFGKVKYKYFIDGANTVATINDYIKTYTNEKTTFKKIYVDYAKSTNKDFLFRDILNRPISIANMQLLHHYSVTVDFPYIDASLPLSQSVDVTRAQYIHINMKRIAEKLKENDKFAIKQPVVKTKSKLNLALAKKTGLVKAVKLKNNSAWNMTWDKSYIYIPTQNDKKERLLEIYDKKSLNLLCFEARFTQSHDNLQPIGVDSNYLYFGNNSWVGYINKETLKGERATKVDNSSKILGRVPNEIDGIREYENHIIAYGEGDKIHVYKNKKLQYTINQKRNYPSNITQIKDYWDYNRVNDVVVHKDILYTANWRGFINIYDFKTGDFTSQINTIAFQKEWNCVVGDNIQDIAVYQDRYIYFAQDYEGVLILDTKTRKITRIKTLFPKKSEYSEFTKSNIDMTKQTDIFQMLFYKDNLIFSEVNSRNNFVYVYSLKEKKIIHTFKGHSDDITEMFIDGDRLIGLSYDGYLYEWDLEILLSKGSR